MKKILSIALMILSLNVFADIDLEEFCKAEFDNTKKSIEAIANNGYIKKRNHSGSKIKYKRTLYRGCRYDIPWMQELRESVCREDKVMPEVLLDEINLPERIFFIFDGAGDFNAESAKRYYSAANLDGSEGVDAFLGNFNGGWAFYGSLKKYLEPTSEVHYHSSSGLSQREGYNSARACGKQINEYFKVANHLSNHKEHKAKWVALGFSNGAILTSEFQHDMGKEGLSLDLAFSVDPVEQALLYFPSKLMSTVGDKKHPLTKRMAVAYQTTDYDSLPNMQLRGKPIKGADVNLEIGHENDSSSMNADGRYNHVKILSSRILLKMLSCELSKALLDSKKDCNYDAFRIKR